MSGTNYIASNWRIPTNQNSSKNDNYSLDFNGSSDFISCGNDPQIQLTGDISISAWFKTSSTSTMIIAAKRDSPLGGTTLGWQVYCTGGNIAFNVTRSGPATTTAVGGTNIADGEWHHVLCTINQDSQIAIILDGSTERTASLAFGTFIDSNSDLRIGYNQVGSQHYYFNGEISEVALFDYLASGATLYGNATSGAGNPMALKPTPVGYWPLGDNSASDPLAQPNVAVEDASVFEFNGSSNQIALTSSFVAAGEFTLSLWMKPTILNSNQNILGNGASSQNWINPNSATNIRVRTSSALLNFPETGGNNLTVGSWNHILIYRDSSNNIGIFVNGAAFSSPQNNSDTLTLATVGRGVNKWFSGNISNVAFWDSDQSSEISSIYNNGAPTTFYTNTPTGWWKLDESANWEADTASAWQIPDAVSEFPQSFDFGSTNDLINCGNSIFNSETALSISAWVKPTAYGSAAAESFVSTDAGSPRAFYLGLFNGTNFRFSLSTNGIALTSLDTAAGTVDLNVWQHILVTWDQVNLKLYKNGDLLKTVATTSSSNGTFTTTNDLLIGDRRNPSAGSFPGKISNVQIWDVALAPGKVTTLYNGGTPTLTPPNQSDLKAWYKLDGSDKSIWNSSSAADTWLIEDNNITPTYTEGLFFGGGYIGGSPVQNYAGLKLTNQTISASHISYSAWVKIVQPEVGSTPTIFNPTKFNYLGNFSYRTSSKSMMWRGDGASKFIDTSSRIDSGSWHHIFCSYPNGSTIDHTQVKIYIDGVLQANTYIGGTTSTGPVTNMLGILLGSAPKNMVISNWAFWLDDQSSNIATIYNNGAPSDLSTLNPEVWYKLDSANTTLNGVTGGEYGVATDSSGNNNSGDIAGKTDGTTTRLETSNVQARTGASAGMTEQSLVNNNVSTLNGESSGMTSGNLVLSDLTRNLPYENYSLEFAGTDYIDCGDNDNLSFGNGTTDSPFTFSAWVKLNLLSGNSTIVSKDLGTIGVTREYALFVLPTGKVKIFIKSQAGNNQQSIESTTALSTGQWYHIGCTYNGVGGNDAADGLTLYVNGSAETPTNVTKQTYVAMSNTTATFRIGKYSTGNIMKGSISNAAIFNSALSSTEVQNLYANGMPQDLTTFTPQPVSWWTLGKESFWDGADWVIRDMIGTNDGLSDNMGGSELKGDAPRSQANGVGTDIAVPTDLKGEAGWSDKNGYSINMSSTARTTDTP